MEDFEIPFKKLNVIHDFLLHTRLRRLGGRGSKEEWDLENAFLDYIEKKLKLKNVVDWRSS